MTPACCWQHGISMIQISLFGVHNNLLRCFWNRLPNPYLQPCMLVKTRWGMLSPLLILPWCIGSKRFWQEFAYFTGRPKTINVIELWLVVKLPLSSPPYKKKRVTISGLQTWTLGRISIHPLWCMSLKSVRARLGSFSLISILLTCACCKWQPLRKHCNRPAC